MADDQNDEQEPLLLAIDRLGLPVTAMRIEELKAHFMFRSDTVSRDVCLTLDALMDRVRGQAASTRRTIQKSEASDGDST
jgi:hypothetical protein